MQHPQNLPFTINAFQVTPRLPLGRTADSAGSAGFAGPEWRPLQAGDQIWLVSNSCYEPIPLRVSAG
jgi:hypothetical protein